MLCVELICRIGRISWHQGPPRVLIGVPAEGCTPIFTVPGMEESFDERLCAGRDLPGSAPSPRRWRRLFRYSRKPFEKVLTALAELEAKGRRLDRVTPLVLDSAISHEGGEQVDPAARVYPRLPGRTLEELPAPISAKVQVPLTIKLVISR